MIEVQKMQLPATISMKMEGLLKPCIGNGTFELRYGTAKSSKMEKR
jgi:hypothetical protein